MFPVALIFMIVSVLIFAIISLIWLVFAISLIVTGVGSLVGIIIWLPMGLASLEALFETNPLEGGLLLAGSIYEFYQDCYHDTRHYNPANFLY